MMDEPEFEKMMERMLGAPIPVALGCHPTDLRAVAGGWADAALGARAFGSNKPAESPQKAVIATDGRRGGRLFSSTASSVTPNFNMLK
jgi:hypothetical protein